MRDPLERPDASGYHRPHQPWICGQAAMGHPCAFGPGPSGVCPALAECQPVEIAGGWQCDRPAVRGGPCDDGPKPDGKCCRTQSCRPVRNLRSLRGAIVRSLAVFAVGVSLMMLGGSWRNQWFAPGPLTTHHAQVLHGAAWQERCTNCHAAAEQPVGAWLTALVGTQLGPTQSTKCLACHDQSIDPQLALVAHNVPAEFLGAEFGTVPAPDSPRAARPLSAAAGARPSQDLACAVCHQEHHGAAHAIAAMDNARCQSCHTHQYDSFAKDHPEFGTWPYQRRTRIAFSHATHSGKHFAEKHRDFACQQCHVEDDTRGVQLTLGYDVACAECHDADIATGTAGGVPLLAMPTLDVEALRDAGHPLDRWPPRATGDFDGRPPAMMKLLLAQDNEARAAMGVLGPDFDFFDIDPDDATHLRATAQLAAATERLLDSLAAGKTGDALVRGLPLGLVDLAREAWTNESGNRGVPPQDGTWRVDATSLSLRYQPTGHADPVLQAWYEAAVAEPDANLRAALVADFSGPAAPGRCTSCHSIESTRTESSGSDVDTSPPGNAPGQLRINWHTYDRRQEPRGFTRFSHTPHLLPVELRDCTACHAVNHAANTASNYNSYTPEAFASDFHPTPKATCAACHNRTAVGENCTQCHNYHIESWQRAR